MGTFRFQIAVEIDGYVAGPDQSVEDDPPSTSPGVVLTGHPREPLEMDGGTTDEFWLHVVPILLGDGARLFENVGDLKLEQDRAAEAPAVTHIKYRVLRP